MKHNQQSENEQNKLRLIAGNKFPKKEWFKEKKLCWIPIFIPMINPLQKYFYELKTCWKKLDTKYDIKLFWNIYDQQYSNEQIKLRLIAGKKSTKNELFKEIIQFSCEIWYAVWNIHEMYHISLLNCRKMRGSRKLDNFEPSIINIC